MVTIYKIAERAGVSTATVSRVINGKSGVSSEKVRRVEEAVRKAAFRPRWKATPSRNIGFVVFPHAGCLSGAYSSSILSGAAEVLFTENYTIQLIPFRHAGSGSSDLGWLLTTYPVEGLLVLALHPTYEVSKLIDCEGIAHITVGPVPEELAAHNIRSDDFAAGYEAAEYLWSLGHRHLAIITAELRNIGHQRQLDGFRKCVADKGGSPDEVLCREFGSARRADGESAARELMLRTDRPTAVFSTNSELAHGFNSACRQMGIRVPDDVSLMGVEDASELTSVDPPMTAMCQPARRLGELAALSLLAQLGDGTWQSPEPLKMTLRVRQSTTQPKSVQETA